MAGMQDPGNTNLKIAIAVPDRNIHSSLLIGDSDPLCAALFPFIAGGEEL